MQAMHGDITFKRLIAWPYNFSKNSQAEQEM